MSLSLNPKTAMDSILAPYGLYSDLIHEWNREFGLVIAGSATVAARTGKFKPNNVDLWVYADPSHYSAKLRQNLRHRGFSESAFVDAKSQVGELLAERLHAIEKFTREDNACYLNLYFTNKPLKDVFPCFDIRMCSLYFDGEDFKEYHWSPTYDIDSRRIVTQHKFITIDRIAKYMHRGYIIGAESILSLGSHAKDLTLSEERLKKEIAALRKRNEALELLYTSAEAACKQRDEKIQMQKEYIAQLQKSNTDAFIIVENQAKAMVQEKEREIAELKEKLFELSRLTA